MNTDVVTMVFFGDGATNQGTFHETLNLASVWQLPVIFFMENNLYGMGSAVGRVRHRGSDFSDAMGAYDIDVVSVDGMDVLAGTRGYTGCNRQCSGSWEPDFY